MQPETILIQTADDERWLSISGVEFFGGTVYAFRDVTDAPGSTSSRRSS